MEEKFLEKNWMDWKCREVKHKCATTKRFSYIGNVNSDDKFLLVEFEGVKVLDHRSGDLVKDLFENKSEGREKHGELFHPDSYMGRKDLTTLLQDWSRTSSVFVF